MINKKNMAKNTLILYLRMLLIMLVTFYTSRMVLKALGVYDFGLYSVVGSIIILFSFIQNVSALATQRFLSVGLGRNDYTWTNKVFNTSFLVHLTICVFVLLFAETAGLWFILHKMNIPVDRVVDVFWVYQISIVSLLFQIMQTPFMAALIALEKMDAFAKIGIFDAFQRWFMVFIFTLFSFDHKIVYYSLFLLAGYFLVFILYFVFCVSKLDICKIKPKISESKELFKEILSFSSWSMIGSLSVVGLSQGIALLTYFFVGVVANGSVWLAEQIMVAFNRIIGTLQTAFNPQIIKQQSILQTQEVASLIKLCCKLTACIVLISAIPVFVDTKVIINLWLSQAPPYLEGLIKIVVVYILIDALSGPYITAIYAVGRLQKYQVTVSVIMILSLVLSFVLYSLGFSIYVAYSARVVCSFALLLYRVLLVSSIASIGYKSFLYNDFPRLAFVTVISILFSEYVNKYLENGLGGLLFLVVINGLFVLVMLSIFSISTTERRFIINLIKKRF
ncbi:hypothetical protein J1786_25335 [Rahnella sp. L72c]|uniref:Polysaccharide biosynthesis protein n=1 Tax=Rahnella perminowiae TaxID=2816244 RepID=A0ABS6L979_9GAMM|nr:hypothetical protein [Rahnella perminowiae]